MRWGFLLDDVTGLVELLVRMIANWISGEIAMGQLLVLVVSKGRIVEHERRIGGGDVGVDWGVR